MEMGVVTGSIWATKKDRRLEGLKLLIVQGDQKKIVAADLTGAGIGDKVLVCLGKAAMITAGAKELPIDAAIIGIIDDSQDAAKGGFHGY